MQRFIPIAIIFFTLIQAQDRTALHITCDTPDIPIYIDGHLVGVTPLHHDVDVLPGWHRVSFFPDVEDGDLETRKLSRDIKQLGTQDIMIESGQRLEIALSYRSLGHNIDDYYHSVRTGSYFGFSMVLIFLSIFVWAYV